MAGPRLITLGRKTLVSNRIRAFSFHSGGDGVADDPHQSPFWIKAVGTTPDGGDTLPLALDEPQKNIGTLPYPSGAVRFFNAAWARWTVFVRREQVATLAIGFTNRWLLPLRSSNPLLVL